MAVSSPPPPRFRLSLRLQNPTPHPSPSHSKPRPAPTTETLRRRLLRRGVSPTPKILHALRKKEALKALRRARKDTEAAAAAAAAAALDPGDGPIAVVEEDEDEARFRAAAAEYRALVGRPWDGAAHGVAPLRGGDGVEEGLEGLREMLVARRGDGFRWLLDDDIEPEAAERKQQKRHGTGWDAEAGDEEKRIQLLVSRLNEDSLSFHDWRLTRMMKKADLIYNEDNLLRILDGLEARGNWRQALAVTEWVYNENSYKHRRSRFVYTKLLSILGKSLRATEALRVFTIMRGDAQIYPDMAAYHSIAVTLGRAGLVKELIKIIEFLRKKPSKRVMKMRRKDWDPSLEPDVLVYNSVLNACVLSQQWKGVFWVFQQMRISGLPPTGATFGLAMEVMLKAKKYEFVQKFYEKMQKNGVPPRAITYKVLVRAFWEQGKINEAVEAVNDMEQRGVVGAASVYYELACCLCNNGRWRDAMLQVDKLKQLPLTKPLEYTFTGMILASFDGGYIYECISIFESMKEYCTPNIGTVNVMLKVYGRCDMFGKAKDLFETTKAYFSNSQTYVHEHSSLTADAYTYSSMLEASASAQQWEYFEYVYREMALSHHHLDQSKYSWLLIKACRAGKSYLLEHALDSVLERGEIPDVRLIVELICQSIAQSDYGRVLQLLNVMTEASIKINEGEWANILQQNVHQFSIDALQDLTDYLSTSGTTKADPVHSLVRALQSQCETTSMKDTYLLVDGGTNTQQCARSLLQNEGENSSSDLAEQDQLTDTCKNLCTNKLIDVPDSNRDIPQLGVAAVMSRATSLSRPRLEDIHGQCDLGHWGTQVSAIDEVLDSMSSYGASSYREMPSASEILELWEQERINDMFDPKAESGTNL
ncbi:hypothetical protein PAHAL_9G415900 [Panicum hallii]|uniref:PROP1-like PPR domain-containing protein n=1 Tax=Panicum hallii TaxID=206008 RepID=A0A2S3IPE7_9POAL|nr:pentatricopeptide repeat-containing protein At5g67570, chloroplastic [Panicum hallii]PAN48965.1 hypothetical protein PAHAL_9G415900 [Panicum hallii]